MISAMRLRISVEPTTRLARVTESFGQSRGIDPDHVMRPQRFEHARDRHVAGLAKVGRAEHRDLSLFAADILDQIADPHDIARNQHGAAEGRRVLCERRGCKT